jgi:hypothetical protein
MANVIYDNFYLANEVEDQFDSHLDLAQFCEVDNTLEGTAGMKKIINVYSATSATEKLAMGEDNTKSIEVAHTPKEYEIILAQNRFEYYDEEAMKDPNLVPVGMKRVGSDLFNTVNGDIYQAFLGTTQVVSASAFNFDAFVDARAKINIENFKGEIFGFVNLKDVAKVRKALKDDLKYVESFVRDGYLGTVGTINLYEKKDATEGVIAGGIKGAVTLFNKKGIEIEQPPRARTEAGKRLNTIFASKYYLAALTDDSKAFKISLNA